mmetsp:Transcript_5455/g.7885  ORF Transcript_5455/g.7885 Transcript_5455/m.7885 type:complete len:664 (+) Transcript_5455:505-2496(+)|eukprot:CAMPEP_0201689218 /NCGR_PEP_ID=MMETSP0578-20130828/2833_1 /ASSEMBLY_ACC=CAM_ASM_000663 /TAXON_ID=267565 /ORGANISM="Skeletonema grethea, Strain CCMP 1804" /LENGTH=663 /DNA_ID=CAMNT_0048173779 /DNA_START=450 /DNA_END=2441 /DNA_ORIENTATION=+
MVSMSIHTHGERMSHQFQYLEDAAYRLFDKVVNRGDYDTRRFTKEHKGLLRRAQRLSGEIMENRACYVDREDYFELLESIFNDSDNRVIITVKEDSTGISMFNHLKRAGIDTWGQIFFLQGGQSPSAQHYFSSAFNNAAGKSVLIVTDRYALRHVNYALGKGLSVTVMNYDTKAYGPINLHKRISDRIQGGGHQLILNNCTARYKELKSSFEQLQSKERRALHDKQQHEASAATTIFCWWRRIQLGSYFAKHQAARIIQLWTRRCLLRLRCKASQAATTIQRWRRSIVNRRKEDKLAEAALSSPLRDKGQPLQQLSRRTRHRYKQHAERQCNSMRYLPKRKRGQRRGRPPNYEGEPELLEPLQEIQQSVKSLQESFDTMEERNQQLAERNQQLVDANTQLLQELRAIRRLLSSSNNGTKPEPVLHNPSELSCRGNVIGNSLHNSSVSGSSCRESVLVKNHRHGGEELHHHDATITQDVIGAALPSRLSGSESVLENSRPTPISSPKGKSSRRRRRRRRHRSKRWKRNKRTLFAIDCIANMSNQPTAVNSKLSGSSSRLTSLDETHSISSTSISSPSTSSEMTSSSVVSSQLTTSKLETSIPIVLNELQSSSSSTPIVDTSPSSTTTLVELTPLTSINTEENSTSHEKPISYLQALIGTTTNFG